MAAFVGHHCGFLCNIGLNNRDYIGRAGSGDMERANLPAITINERQDRILMAMPATPNGSVFAADERFISFNYAANATHRFKGARAHRLADRMTQKPCAFESDPQSAVQLVRANAFLAGTNKVHSGQPIAHGDMAILENGPDLHGERLAASVAFVEASPIAFAFKGRGTLEYSTMRANTPVHPNARLDIGVSGSFIVKMWSGENGPRHG